MKYAVAYGSNAKCGIATSEWWSAKGCYASNRNYFESASPGAVFSIYNFNIKSVMAINTWSFHSETTSQSRYNFISGVLDGVLRCDGLKSFVEFDKFGEIQTRVGDFFRDE